MSWVAGEGRLTSGRVALTKVGDGRTGEGIVGLLRLLVRLFGPPKYERRDHSPQPPASWDHRRSDQHSPQAPWRPLGIPSGHQVLKGRCWVIDGDTIVINKTHIRLAGIDAPELDHPYGKNAKRALMQLCHGQIITATPDGSTSHERLVAICRLDDGRDLSAEMVRAGFALDWAKHSGGRYRHLEADGVRKRLWRADARQKGRMPPSGRVG